MRPAFIVELIDVCDGLITCGAFVLEGLRAGDRLLRPLPSIPVPNLLLASQELGTRTASTKTPTPRFQPGRNLGDTTPLQRTLEGNDGLCPFPGTWCGYSLG